MITQPSPVCQGRRSKRGQSVVEYALFIGLVVVITAGVIGGIGSQTSTVFVDINEGLSQPTRDPQAGSGTGGPPPPPAPSATAYLAGPPTSAPPTSTGGGSFPVPTATKTSVVPTATRTNTSVPPTATATNTSVPPTATATNTSVPQCKVPNFYDVKRKNATSTWQTAGFSGTITLGTGLTTADTKIRYQSLTANSWQPCTSVITVWR